jgi:hypothetical protein
MKAPRTKLQTPEKLQSLSSNTVARRPLLEFDAWDFSGAWSLRFGVFAHVTDVTLLTLQRI